MRAKPTEIRPMAARATYRGMAYSLLIELLALAVVLVLR
jgi:hypothetical protein